MSKKIVMLTILLILLGLTANVSAALRAWWKFDEGSGSNVADSSGNGYTGTITGATWVSGCMGNALDFDGTNDYVSLPTGALSSLSQVTIAFWQYGDPGGSYGTSRSVFDAPNSGNTNLRALITSGSGKLYWYCGQGEFINATPTSSQYKGQWNHYAYTKDVSAGQMKMYINGTLFMSGNSKTKTIPAVTGFRIGSNVSGDSFYNGMVDDLRVYNEVLSQAQIAELAAFTVSGTVGSLDGVTMSGLPGNPVTSGGGAYSGTVSRGWSGTVTPSKTGYSFSPANRTYSNIGACQSAQDYTPSVATYTIYGTITDVDSVYDMNDVTMSGLPGNPVTDENGDYSATVQYGWSGTVTPTKTGFTFTPTNRSYSSVADNHNDSYDATVIRFTLSGNAGLEGVLFVDLPGQPVSDENGDYTCQVDYGWSGIASPELEGYTFAPEERLYDNVTSNQTGQNYTPTIKTFVISGYVGMVEDVVMSGLPNSPTTDETGYYEGTVEYSWTGTVIPVKQYYTFNPVQREYSYVTEDQNDQDYESRLNTNLIGWWMFDGDAEDCSSYGNDGTIVGAQFVSSDRGMVLDFDGINDYVDIPSAALSNVTTEVTIAFWQYGDPSASYSNSRAVFDAPNSGTQNLRGLITSGSGKLYWYAGASDSINATPTASEYKGQWNHYVYTKNVTSGQMKMYINGQLFLSSGGKTKTITGATSFRIGAMSATPANSFYSGMISDLKLYNKALTQSEIIELYTSSYVATNPYPAAGAKNVPTDITISWDPGYLAADDYGHDLYFGTSFADVNAESAGAHIGLQSQIYYDPGQLEQGITYYWKVNEVNDLYSNSPWKGQIWSFTTTDANLLGWWPLNGDAVDHSGNGYDGTVSGATAVDSSKGVVYDFDGTNDYISLPSAALSALEDEVTISLWQFGDPAASYSVSRAAFDSTNSGTQNLRSLLTSGSGKIYWYAGPSDSINDSPTSSSQYKGQWNNFVYTKDVSAGQMKIYINGQLFLSSGGKTKAITGATAFRIGALTSGSNYYDGMICDVRLFDRVLSETEIYNLYARSGSCAASAPNPADGADNIPTDVTLSWTPGYLVDEHDIYFGTNLADVTSRSGSVSVGSQTQATYSPVTLDCNVTYYWAVDEVNGVEDGSPWAGPVWSFTTAPEDDLPPMPDVVTRNLGSPKLGNVPMVIIPIKWEVDGCKYTAGQVAEAAQDKTNSWYNQSNGRVQLVGMNGTGTRMGSFTPDQCAVPYEHGEGLSNAESYLIDHLNIPSNSLKWFVTGSSGGSAGGNTMQTSSLQGFTSTHELGHLFRLGHGWKINYTNNIVTGYDEYGDHTTNMGNVSSGCGFNLPNRHRLGWIDETDVGVFAREDSGTTYRIRHIDNETDTAYVRGLVYYAPVTGNAMWISVHKKGNTYGEDYLGKNLAIIKYINDWSMDSGMQPTYNIENRKGEHTDCMGLTYEKMGIEANGQWVDLKITYNPANDRRKTPLVVTQTQRVLRPVSSGVKGQIEVTLQVTNPNPADTYPCILTKSNLTVSRSYDVQTSWGTSAMDPKQSKRGSMFQIMPGSTTAKEVFIVTSKTGPLSYEDSHLTGSFQLAHRNPFKFSINFE